MDALLVQSKLIGGNIIGSHQSLIGMATGTRGRHVGRIDGRGRVVGFEYLMATMTIEASSHIRVSFGQADAMDALLVLGILIGRQLILAHK